MGYRARYTDWSQEGSVSGFVGLLAGMFLTPVMFFHFAMDDNHWAAGASIFLTLPACVGAAHVVKREIKAWDEL